MVEAEDAAKPFLFRKEFENNELQSWYNDEYICRIISVEINSSGTEISIFIDMTGDMSLGEIQSPLDSTLFCNFTNSNLELLRTEFEKEDECYGYKGLLIYQFQGKEGEYQFTFGFSGYEAAVFEVYFV